MYLQAGVGTDKIPTELTDYPEAHREALFHLIRAVRDFDLRNYDFAALPPHSVSYFLAREEKAAVFRDQVKAAVGMAPDRLENLVYMPESKHAIPDSQGAAAAEIMKMILNDVLPDAASRRWENGNLEVWDLTN